MAKSPESAKKSKKKKKKSKKQRAPEAAAAAEPAPETHPVVEVALDSVRKDAEGIFTLPAEGAEAIEKALAEYYGSDELVPAVGALVALAFYLAEKRCSEAAGDVLLDLLKPAIPQLKKLGIDVDEILNKDSVDTSGRAKQIGEVLGAKSKYQSDPRIKAPSEGGPKGLLGIFDKNFDKK